MVRWLTLITILLFTGCNTITPEPEPEHTQELARQKIAEYNGVWGSKDEEGNTGWCFQNPVPVEDRWILDCMNATPETTVEGMMCPSGGE